MDVAFAYVGITGVLEAAGFTRIAETTAHSTRRTRWLMRLDLAKWTAKRIQAEALSRRLIILTAGTDVNAVRIIPPLVTTASKVDGRWRSWTRA